MRAAQNGLSRHLLSATASDALLDFYKCAHPATLESPWQQFWRVTTSLPVLGRPGQAGRKGPQARSRQAKRDDSLLPAPFGFGRAALGSNCTDRRNAVRDVRQAC